MSNSLIDALKKHGILPENFEEEIGLPQIGSKFYGYCNGYFGDDYGEKVVEAIGPDWIVVRNSRGYALMAEFYPRKTFDELSMVQEWMQEEKYE